MRILLDECVPKPLKQEFADLDIKTVREMGWSGKKNGELLKSMSEAGFTILLTSDRNITLFCHFPIFTNIKNKY